MRPHTRTWIDGLRDSVTARRLQKPLAPPNDPGLAAAERMILATQLATWITGWEAVEEGRRAWIGSAPTDSAPDSDVDPAVVITTSPVGIAVADDLVVSGNPAAQALAGRLVAVTELEYRLWCIRHPDTTHAWHLNLWNWIKTAVPEQRHREFIDHPLAAGECYWLHRAGLTGAGPANRRDCHLWKWNGRHASLLKAFITEGSVGRLGDEW